MRLQSEFLYTSVQSGDFIFVPAVGKPRIAGAGSPGLSCRSNGSVGGFQHHVRVLDGVAARE
jgi:hypothetical protein